MRDVGLSVGSAFFHAKIVFISLVLRDKTSMKTSSKRKNPHRQRSMPMRISLFNFIAILATLPAYNQLERRDGNAIPRQV